jgi:predicted O-methyltransferase YrrM
MASGSPVVKAVRKASCALSARSEAIRIAGALKRAGVPHAARIHTFTKPSELEALYRIAENCPPGAEALEIGAYLGASTCYLAAGLAQVNGHLICVDTWQNETMPDGIRDTFGEFQKSIAPIQQRVTIIRKRSQDLQDSDVSRPLSLAFIDGDHSYEAAKTDFERVKPWILMEGIVAFHDCTSFQGVSRVLGEALASGEWRLDGLVDNLGWIRRIQWKM